MNRIDDLGRVLIPRKLRDPLGWKKGDKIDLIPNVNEKSLSVRLASVTSENPCVIDNLSRIEIPKAVRDLLGWKCTDMIKYILEVNDNSITMMLSA